MVLYVVAVYSAMLTVARVLHVRDETFVSLEHDAAGLVALHLYVRLERHTKLSVWMKPFQLVPTSHFLTQ